MTTTISNHYNLLFGPAFYRKFHQEVGHAQDKTRAQHWVGILYTSSYTPFALCVEKLCFGILLATAFLDFCAWNGCRERVMMLEHFQEHGKQKDRIAQLKRLNLRTPHSRPPMLSFVFCSLVYYRPTCIGTCILEGDGEDTTSAGWLACEDSFFFRISPHRSAGLDGVCIGILLYGRKERLSSRRMNGMEIHAPQLCKGHDKVEV